MKQLLCFCFIFILPILSSGQKITLSKFAYSNFSNNYIFYVLSDFNFGSGGSCPKVKYVITQKSLDTIYIKSLYDFRGIFWAFEGCQSEDSIKYTNIFSDIDYINVSTSSIREVLDSHGDIKSDTTWNQFDTTFGIGAAFLNEIAFINNTLSIYPNPSDGNITIACSVIPKESMSAKVYDLTGRIILQKTIVFSNNQSQIKIEVPQGNYIIELKDETGTSYRQRFLIQ